jgi:hypothetical protein
MLAIITRITIIIIMLKFQHNPDTTRQKNLVPTWYRHVLLYMFSLFVVCYREWCIMTRKNAQGLVVHFNNMKSSVADPDPVLF